MVNDILTAAGLQYRRGRFVGSAPGTYAVYRDDQTTEGSDDRPGILVRHDVTVELYEDRPDDTIETFLEAAIADRGMHYTKQDRYWLQTEQQYQVIYDFTYFEKRRA